MQHKLFATNTGLNVEGRLDAQNINGAGAGVFPRIVIPLSLHIKEEGGDHFARSTQAVSFGILTGELYIGSEKVGDIRPISVNRAGMQSRPYHDEIYQQLEIPLDYRRIEWLEQKRAGKSMEGELNISVSVHVFGSPNKSAKEPFASQVGLLCVSCIQGRIPFTIADTHWREKVLPALGYGKVIAIELPAVSLDACMVLDHSFKALEKAQRQFLLGEYDQTAAFCRMAMEPFFEAVDKGDGSGKVIPKLKKSWEAKLGKATYEWLDDALGAVKADANKPHHSPGNHFDRLGAQMLLIVTTALIAHATRYE